MTRSPMVMLLASLALAACDGEPAPRQVDLASAAPADGERDPAALRRTRDGRLRMPSAGVVDAGASALVARLRSGEPVEVRMALAEALGRATEGAAALAPMIDGTLAIEADPGVRAVLVASLGRVGRRSDRDEVPAIEPVLLRALRDPVAQVRAEAAHAAASSPVGTTVTGALVAAMSDGEPTVRAAAARALGVLAVADAAPALRARARDADPAVRQAIERSLVRIDAQAAAR